MISRRRQSCRLGPPERAIASIAEDLLRGQGRTLLQYGQSEGYPPLLDTLPGYLRDHFSLRVERQDLMITTGSMQGLDLLLRALVNPGDTVLCESPTFIGALQAMHAAGASVVPVPSDGEGMDLDALETLIRKHRPRLIYTIPTFQNPTGRTLSLSRRKRLAQLANSCQVPVAEDDPYRQLRYHGEALPPVKSFDEGGWVILMGSFSKVISPGLRVGFLAGDRELLRRCVIFKQCSDVHTPGLNQAIVHRYLEQGLLPAHIRGICQGYRELMNAMLEELERTPGIRRFTKPEGGLFLFAELAEGVDANKVLALSLERGMVFVPGEPFFPEGGHANPLRLNFSNADLPAIRRGIRILGESLEQYQR